MRVPSAPPNKHMLRAVTHNGDTMSEVTVRPAIVSERAFLEALQWRASLQNPNDREALLKHPDAIVLPVRQIIEGGVFVAERGGKIIGFSAILPREDGIRSWMRSLWNLIRGAKELVAL